MNTKTLVIVGLLVVLLGGGGAAYYFLMRGDAAEAAGAPAEGAEPGLVELETFLTNINDPASERHARLQVKLAVAPKDRAAALQDDSLAVARLRDHVLTQLNAATYEELSNPGGKDAFRKKLAEDLEPLVSPGELEEVLFSDFVVQ